MSGKLIAIVLMAILAIILIFTIGTFEHYFHTEHISYNIRDWGAFGSYVGGILGPSISMLALIGAIVALVRQHESDKMLKDRLEAADFLKGIERLEEDIDISLKSLTINVNEVDEPYLIPCSAYEILTNFLYGRIADKYIPNFMSMKEPDYRRSFGISSDDNMNILGVLTKVSIKLYYLEVLLDNHVLTTGNSAIKNYYKHKYSEAYDILGRLKYPVNEDFLESK